MNSGSLFANTETNNTAEWAGLPSYDCGDVNIGGWEPWWEWISRVEYAGIDNSSNKEAYSFFDQAGPASVTPGSSATLKITPGLSWSGYETHLYFTAYIDWNRDGDFDDAGEEVLRDNTFSEGISIPVSVPSNASPGLTLLRVVMQRDKYAGPCENFSFGEMEDYIVRIEAASNNLTLNCPSDRRVRIPQGATQVALGYTVPTASTTCNAGGLNLSRTSGPGPNATRGAGTYTVKYKATDACGNSKTCSFTVTILAPIASEVSLNCPSDRRVRIPQGATQVALGYTVPTASTTCNAGGLNLSRTSGPGPNATRGAGTYTVKYKATDACGNSKTCSFTVTILAPLGPTVCTERDVTDNELCNRSTDYSFFGDFIRNVSGDGDFFSFVSASFVEYDDGTARLTGNLVNNDNSNVKFNVDVSFSGRTSSAPSGSPKSPRCNGRYQGNDLYYYPIATGKLTGKGLVEGGIIRLSRAGSSFQVGTGGNLNEMNRFGASGWFDATIVSHPSGAATFLANEVVDFNFNLSGNATACITPPSSTCNDKVLFIVGDTRLNDGDQAVKDKLLEYGYRLTIKDPRSASTSDANGKGLVIISSTVSSSDVGNMFTNVSVPLLTWEAWLLDDLKMTGNSARNDYGTSSNAQRLIVQNVHPISAGFSGTRRIANSDQRWSWGEPSSRATIIASVEGQNSSNAAIFAYEAGDNMVGMVAPAKRIGWFWDNSSASHMTANGWQFFSQAVAWATNCGSSSSGRAAAPINLYANVTEQGVELDWITNLKPGEDTFELERENASGDWQVIGLVSVPAQNTGTESFDYLDLNPSIGTNNYRVRVLSPLQSRESQVRSVDYLSADAVTAFPNPASDQVFISLKGFAGFDVDLIVYNALGQEKERIEVINADESPVLIQTGSYNSGIYTVYAVAGGAKKAMRVKIVNE